ncbi:unnamed protein product [Clonostachys rosea f. rosea IK726]|uniref:Uncharacterized protein n=1 Tax=Clonostachys rosea f. rosea IK726 TaxID=1349383 RepID=A0ACA9TWC2_BIOOC|nr:unnamed protein product [Clonostachys rosea f. rosea IK726]
MNARNFCGFEVLISTKNGQATDWDKFWTDFTSAFAWEGTVLMWPTSGKLGPTWTIANTLGIY